MQVNSREIDRHHKRTELNSYDRDEKGTKKRVERQERELNDKDNRDRHGPDGRSRRHGFEADIREHDDRRGEKGSRKTESVSYHRENRENNGKDKRSLHDRDSSPRCHEDRSHRSRR